MDRRTILGILGVVVLLGGVGIALAATGGQGGATDPEVSKQEAKRIATDRVDGTVENVELEREEGPVYEVTVERNDGTLKEVEVDGDSGEILEVETEDDEAGEDDAGEDDAGEDDAGDDDDAGEETGTNGGLSTD